MDSFFYSLLLAAISALTFVAYKHPQAFRTNIAYPLIVLSTLALGFILAFFFGGASTLINKLVTEVSKASQGDLHMLQFGIMTLKAEYDNLLLRLVVVSSFLCYVVLLLNLPKILMIKSDEPA
jgi:hypothetical protein